MACYKPFYMQKPGDVSRAFSCGQCIGCRLERSRQWAVRCVHEVQMCRESCFLTLTYDNKHLPLGGTLVKEHFQEFIKRLRQRCGYHANERGKMVSDVRYFHCGEYGDEGFRPHYHAILFGVDFPDKVFYKSSQGGERLFTSEVLSALWTQGFCIVGAVTFESAAYVARYVVKKVTGAGAAGYYRRVDSETGEVFDLLPEYCTMSLKPGLGAAWLGEFRGDVYPTGEVTVRGKECLAPRYYDKVYRGFDRAGFEALKERRARRSWQRLEDEIPSRRKVREQVHKARAAFLKRTLGGSGDS